VTVWDALEGALTAAEMKQCERRVAAECADVVVAVVLVAGGVVQVVRA
jgi:hypothetical protein